MSNEVGALEAEKKEYELQVDVSLALRWYGIALTPVGSSSKLSNRVYRQIQKMLNCKLSRLNLKKSFPSPTSRSQS